LLGQRLPAGAGIAGLAVQKHEPVIENEAQQSARHYKAADEQTGFVSRSIVAVPMQVGDRMIGVIEIINRRDALPFFEEDVNILTVFADQAVTVVENTRLVALNEQRVPQKLEGTQGIDEAQLANLAKSEFVSFVAHELKNPMTSIKGYVELLAAGSVGQINEMQANFLNTIRANVERMSALISDLNDNAKIEANSLRLDFKQVELPNIVDEAVRSTKRQIEEKHQTLELHVSSQLPLAWADSIRGPDPYEPELITRITYSPGGKIVISAEVVANRWDPKGARQVVHFGYKIMALASGPDAQTKCSKILPV
jgi:signal transduction histidine kinase